MKKRIKKVLAMLMCTVTVLSLAACQGEGKSGGSGEGGDSSKDEVVTLTSYFQFGINIAENYQWFENYLGEEFGIFLESRIQANDSAQLDTMLASGELTDLIGIQDKTQISDAVAGGMLLDLEEYKDQLPNIFGNEKYAAAIQFMKDTFGGVYMMPMSIGESRGVNYDPQLRWDLYRDLGMPEMNDLYDLLDVLKQMQEMEPETKDGLPVYGFGWFPSWDGNASMMAANYNYMNLLGYDAGAISSLVYTKYDGTGEVEYLLDDDSIYKDALQWLYTANQMGLLDPESATIDYEGFVAKANNGQYLHSVWPWFNYGEPDAEEWWGPASVWPEGCLLPDLSMGNPVGQNGRYMGIGADCEHVDKALAFLDWFYSEEGINFILNGPEGILWEYDEDGKQVFTDLFYETEYVGKPYEHPEGGQITGVPAIFNCYPVNLGARNENGQTYQLLSDPYATANFDRTKLQEDFIEHNDGYTTRYDRAEAEGGKNTIKMTPIFTFVQPASNEIEEIRAQIGEIVVTNSWKMVFAADQAEFDALWERTQQDAETLGGEQVYEDAVARWEAAVAASEKYMN